MTVATAIKMRQEGSLQQPTCLKHGEGLRSISSIAHFVVACRMFASYSRELAVPDGVPRERSYPGSLKYGSETRISDWMETNTYTVTLRLFLDLILTDLVVEILNYCNIIIVNKLYSNRDYENLKNDEKKHTNAASAMDHNGPHRSMQKLNKLSAVYLQETRCLRTPFLFGTTMPSVEHTKTYLQTNTG